MEEEQMKSQCEFIKEEDMGGGKWIKLSKITYKDPRGRERLWEAVKRTTKVASDLPDAVVVIPWLRRTLHYDCIILVKQYRPPTKKYTIEFPAGLLDPKETIETCALRELKEETGYVAVVKHISPATALDPGVGDTSAQIVTAEIDGDQKENQNPKAELDDGEFIDVLCVPVDDLLSKLKEFSSAGMMVDSRVYSYAIGMEQTRSMIEKLKKS